MNQKLVESLAQIILALSDEERQWLEREIQKASISKQLEDLKSRLKHFEEVYQMPSEHFYQRFQAGKLGDDINFFGWNAYYEMLTVAQVKAS